MDHLLLPRRGKEILRLAKAKTAYAVEATATTDEILKEMADNGLKLFNKVQTVLNKPGNKPDAGPLLQLSSEALENAREYLKRDEKEVTPLAIGLLFGVALATAAAGAMELLATYSAADHKKRAKKE